MTWADATTYITISGLLLGAIVTVVKHLKTPTKAWEEPMRELEEKLASTNFEVTGIMRETLLIKERVSQQERDLKRAIERLHDKMDHLISVLLNMKEGR